MLVHCINQNLTIKMTHANTGTSNHHYKICDKCYLLPWCKLQTRGHFLIEIRLHHYIWWESVLKHAHRWATRPVYGRSQNKSIKALGCKCWCSTTRRGFAETSARPETVKKNYPILEGNHTEVLSNRHAIYSPTTWETNTILDKFINKHLISHLSFISKISECASPCLSMSSPAFPLSAFSKYTSAAGSLLKSFSPRSPLGFTKAPNIPTFPCLIW